MGSPERTKAFVSLSNNPLTRWVIRKAVGQCGNCGMRIYCSSCVIDVKQALNDLQDPGLLDHRVRAGVAARLGARLFKEKCGRCDRFERCVGYWLRANEVTDPAVHALIIVALSENDNLPQVFEALMRRQGLTTFKLLRKLRWLWKHCDKENLYMTAVTIHGEVRP